MPSNINHKFFKDESEKPEYMKSIHDQTIKEINIENSSSEGIEKITNLENILIAS